MGILSRFGLVTASEAQRQVQQARETLEKSVEEAIRASFGPFETQWGRTPRLDPQRASDIYRKVVWVYASIFAISTTIAGIPLKLYRRQRNGKRIELEDHPAKQRFQRPNRQGMSEFDLIEAAIAWMEITGNAYLVKTLSRVAPGWLELWPLPADRVTIRPAQTSPKGPLLAGRFVYRGGWDQDQAVFDANEIIHFRQFGTDPMLGMGSVEPIMGAGLAYLYAERHNSMFFKNSARPDLIVKTGMPHDPVAETNLRKAWNAELSGEANRHRVKVLWGQGASAEPLTTTIKDMDFPNLVKVMREGILGGTGVPPFKIGILDHANYANSDQQRHEFLTGTCSPKMRKFTGSLSRATQEDYQDERLSWDFDTNGVEGFGEDRTILHLRTREDWQAGLITLNAAREQIGEDDLGEPGEVLMMQGKLVRVAELAELPNNPADAPEPPRAPPPTPPQGPTPEEPTGEERATFPPQLKVLPLSRQPDRTQRLALWKQFDDLSGGMIEPFAEAYTVIVGEQLERALAGLKRTNFRQESIGTALSFLTQPVVEDVSDWSERFRPLLADLAERGARQAERQARAMVARATDSLDLIDAEVIGWAQEHAADLVVDISRTNRDVIRRVVEEGIAAGESESTIADQLYQKLKFSTDRTLRIARTESTAAHNFGTMAAYRTNPGVGAKEWLSSQDELVRDPNAERPSTVSHRIDGQRQPLEQPFELPDSRQGIVRLQYPGEYGAAPWATINCRCTMIPVPQGGLLEVGSELENAGAL